MTMIHAPEPMPKNLAEWKDQQQNLAIFRMKGQEPESEACRLLEIGPTNRIVTDQEAKLLLICRTTAVTLGPEYRWLIELSNAVEEYQLTIGVPKNSRDAFGTVLTQALRSENQKQLSFFDRLTGKKPEEA